MTPRKSFTWLLFSFLTLTGCDTFGQGNPGEARVTVEGAEGQTIQLVTTSDFLYIASQDFEERSLTVFSADTTTVTSPFSQSYSLGAELRFLVQLFSPEPLTEPVTLKVFIEDDRRFYGASMLGEDILEFVYTFR